METVQGGVRRTLIWDWPTRLFHWSLVAAFVGAWLTRENDGQRMLHVLFGYTVFALVLFRLAWGFIGTRHARFASFIRSPAAAFAYLRGRAVDYAGHNPAGAFAIVAMLAMALGSGITGWMMATARAPESLEEVHEFFANGLWVVVALHVLGVIAGSLRHRQNLVRAMIDGRKRTDAAQGIMSARPAVALVMLLAMAGFWGWGLSQPQLPFGLSAGIEQEGGETGGDSRGERGEHGDEDNARDRD